MERWRRRPVSEPTVSSSENLIELAALERLLARAGGFSIAFAVVNHPTLRDRLVEAVRADLPDQRIAELELDPAASGGVVRAIEQASHGADALFVHGLQTLAPLDDAPGFAELNLNRDHLRGTVPMPIVCWAPDYAIRAFARQAADLWSGRSGLYRFEPEPGDPAATSDAAARGFDWSLTPEERREREALLRDVLDELEESGEDAPARADVAVSLGNAAGMQARHAEAVALYEQALPTYRELGDRLGEANTLKALGDAAGMQARYAEAVALYEQALPTYRELGDRLGEANTLTALGDAAGMQARYAEAVALYEQALPTYREL
ncbi:MAG: tetratricopeptide repeat protein, partial [Gaiellaceae bacterium]